MQMISCQESDFGDNKQPRSRTRLKEDEKGKRVSNSDRWTDLRRDIEYKKLYSIWILLCLKYNNKSS